MNRSRSEQWMAPGIESNISTMREATWRRSRKRIAVKGGGRFPFDMLRYDACWPATETDSNMLVQEDTDERTVVLFTDNEYGVTLRRWQSQGWRVHAVNAVGR